MDLAVVLYFDASSEKTIFDIQDKVSKNNVNDYIIDNKIPPHLTLSIFTVGDTNDAIDAAKEFTNEIKQNEICLSSVGIFNTQPAVIYLAPIVTEYLKEIHVLLQNKIIDKVKSIDPYYLSENWVPHCAIAVKLEDEELHNALTTVSSEFTPLTCQIERVAIAKCCPFRELEAWDIRLNE